jgi:hypothetical protein
VALPALLLQAGCAAADGRQPFARPMPLAVPEGTPLVPVGALLLDTAGLRLGGLSGLHLSPDLRVSAVSDRGRWLTGQLLLQDGRVASLGGVQSGPLRDGNGEPLPRGHAADAEALARLPDGTWLVAYERWHRVRTHRPTLDSPGRYVDVPAALAQAPGNAGLEALAVLPDGRWLLITERFAVPEEPGLRRAWIGRPGGWTALGYRPAPGMDPVDAVALPEDGGVLVLERGFSLLGGFTGRLVRLPASALAGAREGSVLGGGEELLRIEPPLPVDNYEGVAAARVGGRTLITLVSDDNENALQRSWLLVFALP